MNQRERDAKIAERLFGYKWHKWLAKSGHSVRFLSADSDQLAADGAEPLAAQWYRYVPSYSTDPAAMLALLDKLTELGWLTEIVYGCRQHCPHGPDLRHWHVILCRDWVNKDQEGCSASLPEAVALAAEKVIDLPSAGAGEEVAP